jgi:small subunit ribosomal protein S17
MGKTLVGRVSSASPDKTIVIAVHTRKTHPLYKKQYSVTTKYMAHDEENSCKVGDRVSIVETKPISARKRFKLEKILERASLTKEDLKAMETEEEAKKTDDKTEEKSE